MDDVNAPSYDEAGNDSGKFKMSISISPPPNKEKTRCFTLRPRKYVVEPLIVLYLISGFPMYTVIDQWTYVKIGEDMGIDVNTNHKHNISEHCSKGNCSLDLVQAASVDFKMKLNLAGLIPQFFAPLIIGALSDKYGRKLMLLLPCLSSLIMVTTYLTVMWFKLSIWWVYFNLLNYIFGSWDVMMNGCYAYIADTVPREERGFRMTMIDMIGFSCGSLVSLLVGYIVTRTDFWVPLVGVYIAKILVLLYVIFCVPETLTTKPSEQKVTLKQLLSGVKIFFIDNGTGRVWRLWLLMMMMNLPDLISQWSVQSEYFMNDPRNWTSFQMSIYSAISSVIEGIVVLLFSAISYKYVPIKYRVIIGRISGAARDACMAFATSTALLLIAPAVGCLNSLAIPIIRTLMTYQVASNEQGSMLSIISATSTIFSLISTFASAKLYEATEPTWDGCIFFVSSILQIVTVLLMALYMILTRSDPEPNLTDEDEKNIVEDDQIEEDSEDIKELVN